MHGRRVDIIEYEHRWMHERGACDCEVNFPGMLQPRLIQRSSAAVDENNAAATTTEAGCSAASEQDVSPKTTHAGGHRITTSIPPGRDGEQATVPLYKEAHVGNSVEVAVRLTSLYGAEWTKDHAKLHRSGQCNCPVSFESYKPIDVDSSQGKIIEVCTGDGSRLYVIVDGAESSKLEYSDSPDWTRETGRDRSSQKHGSHSKPTAAAASSYGSDARTSSIDNNSVGGPSHQYRHGQVPIGHVARWAMEGPQGSLLDEILGPMRPDASMCGGRPVDIQTMHYSTSGIPISGDPIVCGTTLANELPSIVEFQQPETTIAGFPIGAGPEGESHAGDFETCSLQSSFEDSPVKMRRLSSEF
ncbi:hypothetical protein ANO14919_111400 [Xylariales sp. No.14919]|nr:hypothetical protein ANO14919_111400 [Xylariales sp. No.14919]